VSANSRCVLCALKDNLFEWHFTIRGPADSEFDGGIYHGRIILPPEYPMKPPSIIILTVRDALLSLYSSYIKIFIVHSSVMLKQLVLTQKQTFLVHLIVDLVLN